MSNNETTPTPEGAHSERVHPLVSKYPDRDTATHKEWADYWAMRDAYKDLDGDAYELLVKISFDGGATGGGHARLIYKQAIRSLKRGEFKSLGMKADWLENQGSRPFPLELIAAMYSMATGTPIDKIDPIKRLTAVAKKRPKKRPEYAVMQSHIRWVGDSRKPPADRELADFLAALAEVGLIVNWGELTRGTV